MKSVPSFYNQFWSSVLHYQIASRAGINFSIWCCQSNEIKTTVYIFKIKKKINYLGKLNILECVH